MIACLRPPFYPADLIADPTSDKAETTGVSPLSKQYGRSWRRVAKIVAFWALVPFGLLSAAVWTGSYAHGQTQQKRPFWPEIRAFSARDRASPPRPCRTLFIGSSSIRLWSNIERDFPRLQIVQRGFGGGHLSHVVRYYDLLIEPHRPSAIILYAGENDIAAGRPPADILAALKSLLKLKTKSLGPTPVYFIAIKPSLYHWDKFARQTRANQLVRDFATTRDDLVFIDVVPQMLKDGRPKRIYLGDGLHMNRDGYAIWTNMLQSALAQSGATKAQHCQP